MRPGSFLLKKKWFRNGKRIICGFRQVWWDAMQGANRAAVPSTASDWQRSSAPTRRRINSQIILLPFLRAKGRVCVHKRKTFTDNSRLFVASILRMMFRDVLLIPCAGTICAFARRLTGALLRCRSLAVGWHCGTIDALHRIPPDLFKSANCSRARYRRTIASAPAWFYGNYWHCRSKRMHVLSLAYGAHLEPAHSHS